MGLDGTRRTLPLSSQPIHTTIVADKENVLMNDESN